MPCRNCEKSTQYAKTGRAWPGFSMSCAPCCARLVKSARPLRTAQDAMLYAITRRPGRPTRSDVLQTLKALDAASAPRS
jgi:hypothetical protein